MAIRPRCGVPLHHFTCRFVPQEPFNNGVSLLPNSVVDIWANSTKNPGRVAAVIRNASLRATTSLGWYLNHAPDTCVRAHALSPHVHRGCS